MSIIDLRQTLSSAFNDIIGNYTWSNGHTANAIAVGNPPNEVKVSGLELIISIGGSGSSKWLTNSLEVTTRYQIYLVRRDGASLQDFVTGMERMQTLFPRTNHNYIPQNETVGSFEQFVTTFEDISVKDATYV